MTDVDVPEMGREILALPLHIHQFMLSTNYKLDTLTDLARNLSSTCLLARWFTETLQTSL